MLRLAFIEPDFAVTWASFLFTSSLLNEINAKSSSIALSKTLRNDSRFIASGRARYQTIGATATRLKPVTAMSQIFLPNDPPIVDSLPQSRSTMIVRVNLRPIQHKRSCKPNYTSNSKEPSRTRFVCSSRPKANNLPARPELDLDQPIRRKHSQCPSQAKGGKSKSPQHTVVKSSVSPARLLIGLVKSR